MVMTADVSTDAPALQPSIPVHLCGRAYFRKLAENRRADNPNVTEASRSRLILQGRSLCHGLQVMQRRLQSLLDDETHTSQDVRHYQLLLSDVEQRWRTGDSFDACLQYVEPGIQDLCEKLFNCNKDLLKKLEDSTAEMPDATKSVYDELLSIEQQLVALQSRRHTFLEMRPLQVQLDDIRHGRAESGGVWGGVQRTESAATAVVPKGQVVCTELLHHCYDLIEELTHTAEDVSSEMRYACSRLHSVRSSLMELQENAGHTQQDLQHYKALMADVERSLQHGLYNSTPVDSESTESGSEEEACCQGRPVADQLLQQCYELLGVLQVNAVDMPASVQSVYDTLISCRDRLDSLSSAPLVDNTVLKDVLQDLDVVDQDKIRNHGIFGGASAKGFPAGQSVCTALLRQCHYLTDLAMRKSCSQ